MPQSLRSFAMTAGSAVLHFALWLLTSPSSVSICVYLWLGFLLASLAVPIRFPLTAFRYPHPTLDCGSKAPAFITGSVLPAGRAAARCRTPNQPIFALLPFALICVHLCLSVVHSLCSLWLCGGILPTAFRLAQPAHCHRVTLDLASEIAIICGWLWKDLTTNT